MQISVHILIEDIINFKIYFMGKKGVSICYPAKELGMNMRKKTDCDYLMLLLFQFKVELSGEMRHIDKTVSLLMTLLVVLVAGNLLSSSPSQDLPYFTIVP